VESTVHDARSCANIIPTRHTAQPMQPQSVPREKSKGALQWQKEHGRKQQQNKQNNTQETTSLAKVTPHMHDSTLSPCAVHVASQEVFRSASVAMMFRVPPLLPCVAAKSPDVMTCNPGPCAEPSCPSAPRCSNCCLEASELLAAFKPLTAPCMTSGVESVATGGGVSGQPPENIKATTHDSQFPNPPPPPPPPPHTRIDPRTMQILGNGVYL